MSTWAYCTDCGNSMHKPTLTDAFVGQQHCIHCETNRYLDESERRLFIEDFVEGLSKVQEVLKEARAFIGPYKLPVIENIDNILEVLGRDT
jgi:hypothetical protein